MTEHANAEPSPRDPKPDPNAPSPVVIKPATDWRNAPVPTPVLWRDFEEGEPSPVLSVGEVALLSAAGGLGKSTVTVSWAAACASAWANRKDHGRACGLRILPGPVVMVSYEDTPPRVLNRLGWYAPQGTATDAVHLVEDPPPLWEVDSRDTGKCANWWPELWQYIRTADARLVVIDPATAACPAPSSEAPAVRAFLAALQSEARPKPDWAGCGVLIVAHSTKAARNALQHGDDPGAGAVAGSAAWYDGARGILTLYRGVKNNSAYLLHCIKSNYGRTGWGHRLKEQYDGNRWRGLRAANDNALDPLGVENWLQEHQKQERRNTTTKEKGRRDITTADNLSSDNDGIEY